MWKSKSINRPSSMQSRTGSGSTGTLIVLSYTTVISSMTIGDSLLASTSIGFGLEIRSPGNQGGDAGSDHLNGEKRDLRFAPVDMKCDSPLRVDGRGAPSFKVRFGTQGSNIALMARRRCANADGKRRSVVGATGCESRISEGY